MPLAKSISCDDISISLWYITESEEELVKITAYSNKLPRNPARRKERLAVVAILQSLNLPANYCYDQWGRPYIAGNEFFISITHTEGLAAIALSKIQPVGIDVEHLGRDFQRVSGKYLTEREASHASRYSHEHFALTWCAKESIYKLPWPKSMVFNRDIEIIFESDTFKRGWLIAKVQNTGEQITLKVFFTFMNRYCLAWVGMNTF